MAKALFGHVGSAPDRRLVDEVTQLRARVRALEFEVTRLRAENDRLAAAAAESDHLVRLIEPAMACGLPAPNGGARIEISVAFTRSLPTGEGSRSPPAQS